MSDRIEKSIELKATVSRVWHALTDHREFGSWFGVRLESPFVVGKTAVGEKANPCGGNARFEAVVQRMEPERLLAFTWRPYGIDPDEDRSKEPPTLVEFIFETIQQIHAEGVAILLVEQNALQALAIASRGYVLQTGRVLMADTAEALAANEDVRRAYLGEI